MPDRIERLSLLAQALVSAPDWSELARLLVLRIFDSWGCTAAAFFVPAANRSMSLDAAYGYSDEQATSFHYLAPNSEPFVAAIRNLLELHGGAADWAARSNGAHGNGDIVEERPNVASDVDLSARQLRILELLALGKTNRWIAADLGFSESTIRQETLRLYRALAVNSRVDAVVVAREIGLIASA